MKFLFLLILVTNFQLAFAESFSVKSNLWGHSYTSTPLGKVKIIKGENQDKVTAIIEINGSVNLLDLKVIDRFQRRSYIKYELDGDNEYFSFTELDIAYKNGEWSITRLRLFDLMNRMALFIVQNTRSGSSDDSCPGSVRFCN